MNQHSPFHTMASSLIQLTLSLSLLLLTQYSTFVYSTTQESDIDVLRALKQSIDPNSISSASFLNTWNFETDPCESTDGRFLGLLCSTPENREAESRVVQIDLEGDSVEGFLTPSIGNLTELTLLNLRNNRFRGPIPSSLINLKKLTRLLISDNFFSGSIPPGIFTLTLLQIVDLSSNRLSGSIPSSVSNLRLLNQLFLANNEFSGRIPSLISLWQLRALDLSGNELYGDIPRLPISLTTLSLAHNLLTGHISPVNNLHRLRALDLSDNRFTEEIDPEIFMLPDVTVVNISSNMFTSITVPRRSGVPSQLRTVEAGGNRIRGHLPVNLVTYENLESVNLGHNLFTGEIPREFGRKLGGSWRSLYLDYNMLEGNIPSGFTSDMNRYRGSIAHNCINNCPRGLSICSGGQRPRSECVRRGHDDQS